MTPDEYGGDQGAPPLTPARILDAWRRRKWVALTAGAAVLVAAITVIRSLPNLYAASATLMVQRDVSEEFVKPSVTAGLETRIQTLQELVTSRDRLAEVINQMHLYPALRGHASMDDLVAAMRGDISLQTKAVPQTSGGTTTIAFTVGYTGRDPNVVAAVANRLAAIYTDENGRTRQREAASTVAFLRQQLDEVKGALDGQERETRAYTMAHTSELPQQLAANISALDRVHSELSANADQQLRLIDQRQRIEQEAAAPVPVASLDTASPATRLAALRQQLVTLRRSFSDEYPDVKRLKSEIASVEAEVARTTPAGTRAGALDPAQRRAQDLRDIDTQMQTLRREEAALRQRSAQYEAIVGSTPRRQIDLDQLTRSRDSLDQRYQELLKQYDDARQAMVLEEGRNVERFTVLDAAIPPRAPIAPNRLLLEAMALAAALVVMIGVVVALEKFDASIHTPDDLRDLVDAAVIVPLRRIPTRRSRRRAWLRAAAGAAAALLVIAIAGLAAYHLAAGSEQIVRMTMRGGA